MRSQGGGSGPGPFCLLVSIVLGALGVVSFGAFFKFFGILWVIGFVIILIFAIATHGKDE